MTEKTIELLNNTGKPFFLMIEGSQIDWGAHDNDPVYTALEAIEFEKSVKYAQELGKNDTNLQILVTADHETGGLSVGDYSFTTALPLETDDYDTVKSKRISRVAEVETSWSTGGHTTKEVILAGMGPNSEKILNAVHHINTFSIMREIIDGKTEPSQSGVYAGHVNWILISYLSLLGIAALLTGILTWIKEKKRNN
jgi:alkaline phosphatase